MTTVISVRGKKRDELLADPNFVYVGRKVKFTEWEASIWGNPFYIWNGQVCWDRRKIDDSWVEDQRSQGIDDAVRLYFRWLLNQELIDRIDELTNKTLGCWCGTWEPGQPKIGCHAVVLATLAEIVKGGPTP